MRCPTCNRFVSYDEQDPEVESVEIAGSDLSAEIRVVLPCADCGEELKQNNFTFETKIDHTCTPEALEALGAQTCPECEGSGQVLVEGLDTPEDCPDCDGFGARNLTEDDVENWEGERYESDESDVSASFTSREERTYYDKRTKTRKPIKSYRYVRTYYGAELSIPVTCLICKEEFSVEGSVEEMASAFESLV